MVSPAAATRGAISAHAPGLEGLVTAFYTVPRVGQEKLSDGGGPFGFDITTALQVDFLLRAYECDGIVETGCFLGDTTDYLARRYPHLPVRTCDVDERSATFTRLRLRGHDNVTVALGDSAELLPRLLQGLQRPLVYLDAHWNPHWPLREELAAIRRGVVAVDDFDIGHPRFGYDHYDDVVCGPGLLAEALPALEEVYVGNPYASYALPCLQVGRRSGTGYFAHDLPDGPLATSRMFVRVPLRPHVVLPPWDLHARPNTPRGAGA